MNIRPLTADDFDAILAAFSDAFSDYVIPFALDAARLRQIVARRCVRWDASVGAFDDGRIVGFTLNGVDGDRGYDSGTGVVPSHRRRGIARALMESSFALLRERGVASYVLEVIETNANATQLYRALGFVETRRLQCWTYSPRARGRFTELANADLPRIRSWCDVTPSWQNDTPSIARAIEPCAIIGDEDAAAIVYPLSGDLAQLAVSRDARRRGIGQRLLDAAATRANKPLRILNVDDSDAGIAAFLETAGAQRTLRQIEMVRAL
jgi:ribosomal protein S18 acetylase RimI-like enzyme